MLDPAIEAFFTERKEAWLEKNLKGELDESQVIKKKQECEQRFSLKNWIPNAAQRICSRALSTHPSKFSHPSTGVGKTNKKDGSFVSPILFEGTYRIDGYLRSGNVRFELIDSVGNAGELDVEDFLRIVISDGMTVIQHIENETSLGKEILEVDGCSYKELREGLLVIKSSNEPISTNSKIKQVYFPIADEKYHLLSLLTHSGHLFEQRKRIEDLRFSEQVTVARECRKNDKYHALGYSEIFGITTIGYGGTKPANISVLNNQNAGKAHLLASVPPELRQRDIRLPRTDFFKECFTAWQAKEILEALHRLYITDHNNIDIRQGRDYRIQQYVDLVIEKMWQVRLFLAEHQGELSSELPLEQKIWLYPDRELQREQENEWLNKITRHIARSLINHYSRNKFISTPVMLADQELLAIEDIVNVNKESLR
ncbi:type I-F CRISPR-associated protein Csy1 [Neptunomonas concharum]|uniref:Type I-F CRISPR-associated protein Csy1 n=1 Tax=Neptunomonas concharum TaxID=1031538 RepID=A0A5P1R8G8_9GAMM|nr:type I-F CRISPR-associated protein Csy1 [Neptunomonas concharum]QEQ95576.1 type I-F CRISPR-associated protein Csy1 [Neptunomonas concharum]